MVIESPSSVEPAHRSDLHHARLETAAQGAAASCASAVKRVKSVTAALRAVGGSDDEHSDREDRGSDCAGSLGCPPRWRRCCCLPRRRGAAAAPPCHAGRSTTAAPPAPAAPQQPAQAACRRPASHSTARICCSRAGVIRRSRWCRRPPAHEVAVHHVAGNGVKAFGALAYDMTSHTLWACGSYSTTAATERNSTEVGTIDLATDTYTPRFTDQGLHQRAGGRSRPTGHCGRARTSRRRSRTTAPTAPCGRRRTSAACSAAPARRRTRPTAAATPA